MAWRPSYRVEGLFKPFIPTGTLNGLKTLCQTYGNFYDVTNGIAGNYNTSYWDESGAVSWPASFGKYIEESVVSHIKSDAWHGGSTHSGIDLIEIYIDNPEGAQFYKQSLVVIGEYQCSNYVEARAYHNEELHVLDYAPSEIGILKFARREYPTPYSTYTQTILAEYTIAVPFNVPLMGSDDLWVEPLFYFYQYMKFVMGDVEHDNHKYFCFGFYGNNKRQTSYEDPKRNEFYGTFGGLSYEYLDTVFGTFIPDEQDDPNEEEEGDEDGDENGGGGGHGGHILPEDIIPVPPVPDVSPADISWLTVYKMASTQISEFGEEMLEPTLWDAIKQFFNNPLEAIVNISLVPVDAPSSRSKKPSVGRGPLAKEWTNAYPVVDNQYVQIDCGYVTIEPYWDSAFDYDPYTKINIFLPFIGFRPLKADEVMRKTIGVKYNFDVVTGDCVAFVYRSSLPGYEEVGPNPMGVIASFNGNCSVSVPMARQSADNAIMASATLMSQAVGMGFHTAGSLGGGGQLSDASDMSSGQIGNQISSATMTAVNGLKQHIERSGNMGGDSGYMGILDPYIILEIPNQILPKPNKNYYWKLEGYPCNFGGTLGDMRGTGLQVVEAIQLNDIPAMEDERAEIMNWLKKGVIV